MFSCSASPCPTDENPHCIEYEDWDASRCKTCEDGYFFKSVGSPCVSCEEVYYGTCAECENVDGCNICRCGDREYDGSCGIRFCDDSEACATFVTGPDTDTDTGTDTSGTGSTGTDTSGTDTNTDTDTDTSTFVSTRTTPLTTTTTDIIKATGATYECPSEYVICFLIFE